MSARKRLEKFTEHCRDLFDAGVTPAKVSAPKDLKGRWETVAGQMFVEAEEEKGGKPDHPDSEMALIVKVAGKTLFSAQAHVRYADKKPERSSERVEKFVLDRWKQALRAAFALLAKRL